MMADNQLLNDNNDEGVGGGDDIFVYTGGEQEVPRDVKRVRIAENIDTIPEGTFYECRQLLEVEGHNKIRKIEKFAFYRCRRLKWVKNMTGLIEIDEWAFCTCTALSDIDFDKLKIVGVGAFSDCTSLRSINMPSIRRVCGSAFSRCALTDAVFGPDLETIGGYAFYECTALKRIAIPLKDNLVVINNAFCNCENLVSVNILDEGIHKTISSLHLETWRNEMKEEIDSINQALLVTLAIEKAEAIKQWIRSAHSRMEHYKTEHQTLLKEAMVLLELALWKANLCENEDAQEGVRVTRGQRKRARKDRCITSGASIVIKNVLPFLALK
jgi:hypothetical protein